jgi:pimeloyl-ACP methyl ester carboxylesterase
MGIALEELAYPAEVRFLETTVEGQRVRMAYMDVAPKGAASGRTVVLLHGKNFDGGTWSGVMEALGRAGFRVVVPDQLGFNKSSKPDVAYTFTLLAAKTFELLDTLGVTTVDVIGHSTGGMLAARMALDTPGRVHRLVLEDPVGLEDYRQVIDMPPLAQLVRDELEQSDAQIDAFVHRYFVHWRPEFQRTVDWRQRIRKSGEFPRWAVASARLYQMIVSQPVRGELSRLRPPVLLVTGEKDRTVVLRKYARPGVADRLGDYPALSRAAARDIPRCTRVEVPDVGHVPHLEAPEAFLAALLPFLTARDAAAPAR